MTTVLVVGSFEDKAGLGATREHIGLAPFLPVKDMKGCSTRVILLGYVAHWLDNCLTPTFETTSPGFLGTVQPVPLLERDAKNL